VKGGLLLEVFLLLLELAALRGGRATEFKRAKVAPGFARGATDQGGARQGPGGGGTYKLSS